MMMSKRLWSVFALILAVGLSVGLAACGGDDDDDDSGTDDDADDDADDGVDDDDADDDADDDMDDDADDDADDDTDDDVDDDADDDSDDDADDDADDDTDVLFTYNFESDDVGGRPDPLKWLVGADGGSDVTVTDTYPTKVAFGNVAEFVRPATTDAYLSMRHLFYPAVTAAFVIEFDMLVVGDNAGLRIYDDLGDLDFEDVVYTLESDADTGHWNVWTDFDGSFATPHDVGPIPSDWAHYKIVLDPATKSTETYIDDVLVGGSLEFFVDTLTQMSTISFACFSGTSAAGDFYLDNVQVYLETPI